MFFFFSRRPYVATEDGNVVFVSADSRDIQFRPGPGGNVKIGDVTLSPMGNKEKRYGRSSVFPAALFDDDCVSQGDVGLTGTDGVPGIPGTKGEVGVKGGKGEGGIGGVKGRHFLQCYS